MPQDLINDKSALVQVMPVCTKATSHYLNLGWSAYILLYMFMATSEAIGLISCHFDWIDLIVMNFAHTTAVPLHWQSGYPWSVQNFVSIWVLKSDSVNKIETDGK